MQLAKSIRKVIYAIFLIFLMLLNPSVADDPSGATDCTTHGIKISVCLQSLSLPPLAGGVVLAGTSVQQRGSHTTGTTQHRARQPGQASSLYHTQPQY